MGRRVEYSFITSCANHEQAREWCQALLDSFERVNPRETSVDFEIKIVLPPAEWARAQSDESWIRDSRIQSLSLEWGDRNLARQRGACEALGAYLVFLDADTVPDSEWLTHFLNEHHAVPGLFAGEYASAPELSWPERIDNWISNRWLHMSRGCRFLAGHVAIPRAYFEAGLQFPVGWERGGEEVLMSDWVDRQRLGFFRSKTCRLLHQNRIGWAALMRKHLRHLTTKHFQRRSFAAAGFSLIEVAVVMGLAAGILVLASSFGLQMTLMARQTLDRFDGQQEVLRLERDIRYHLRHALRVSRGVSATNAWIREFDSSASSGVSTLAVFHHEAGKNRIGGVDSSIQRTGFFFSAPNPGVPNSDGIFLIASSLTQDPRPSDAQLVVRRVVRFQIDEITEQNLGFGTSYVTSARIRATLRLPQVQGQQNSMICYLPSGCPTEQPTVDFDSSFYVNFKNNLISAPVATDEFVRNSLIYFFQPF